jgi:hypothetical protein
MPTVVLESVASNGALLGVPLYLYRQNTAYYNLSVLEAEGLEPPTKVHAILEFARTLQELGYEAPLCVPDAARAPSEPGCDSLLRGHLSPVDIIRHSPLVPRLNSGQSTEPHLHFHIQDTQSMWWAQGVPVAFLASGEADVSAKAQWLTRGDTASFGPTPALRWQDSK